MEEALRQLLYSNADLDNSVKLVDKRDNKIYGLLIFSHFNIDVGSPLNYQNNTLSKYLKSFKQLNGHSFIIDKRLRGVGFDKKMLKFNTNFIDCFDLVWIGVDKTLKTHNYWKKIGFEPLFEIDDAIFYINTKDKMNMLNIFIFKALSEKYENNNY